MSRAKLILFTPGPVRTPPAVTDYLADPPVNYHRQDGFRRMFAETERDVKELVGITDGAAYFATMLISTGTGAVEACLQAFAPLGKGLLLRNGFFGARWVDQATQGGIAHTVLDGDDQQPIDVARLEAALDADPSIKWVFFVAHETRAGLVNPMVAIGQACQRRGLLCGSDVISAAYAYPIDIEAAGLDLAVTSSAKAIQAIAGIGIVFVKLASLPRLAAHRRTSQYFDLVAETDKQRKEQQTRFAQPVHLHAALRAACDHLKQLGIAAHFARIRRQLQTIHDHLLRLGVAAQLDPAHRSWVAVNFRLPAGLEYPEFARRMEAEGFYLLYGIPGDMTHFQISTIGDLSDEHVAAICRAFDKVLGRARAAA